MKTFSETIKGAIEKTGKFVKNHKATIISIVGPSILALIAKEWGLDLDITKKPAPPAEKPKTVNDILSAMTYRPEDPVSMAILSFMKGAKNTYSDRNKIAAAEKIFNTLADSDSVDDFNKTLAIKALDSIGGSTYSDSVKRTVSDYIASIAAIKVPKKQEEPETKDSEPEEKPAES